MVRRRKVADSTAASDGARALAGSECYSVARAGAAVRRSSARPRVAIDRVRDHVGRDAVADEHAPVDDVGGQRDVRLPGREAAAVHRDEPLAAAVAGEHEAGGLAVAGALAPARAPCSASARRGRTSARGAAAPAPGPTSPTMPAEVVGVDPRLERAEDDRVVAVELEATPVRGVLRRTVGPRAVRVDRCPPQRRCASSSGRPSSCSTKAAVRRLDVGLRASRGSASHRPPARGGSPAPPRGSPGRGR